MTELRRPYVSTPRAPALLAALLLLLAAGACTESADSDVADAPRGAFCAEERSCAEGLVCLASRCTVPGDEPLQAILRITPPGHAEGLVPQVLPNVRLEGGTLVPDIALSAPVRVRGRVLFDSPDPDARTPIRQAEVRFVEATGLIELRAQATTVSDARTGRFDLSLPPGRYDVTIRPAQSDIPPARFLNQEITNDAEQLFILPPVGRYRRLQGRVVREDPTNGALIPLVSVRVFAQSPDREYLSTTARTDTDGRFEVFAPADVRQYKLLVRSEGDALAPSATFEALTLDRDAQEKEWLFHLGRWDAPTMRQGVLRSDEDDRPISGTVSAQLTSPPEAPSTGDLPDNVVALERINFTNSATTDAEGRYRMRLYPGTYALLGASLSREHAVTRQDGVHIGTGAELLDVRLGLRRPINGRVVDDGGVEALVGAAVVFEPLLLENRDAADFTVPIQLLGDSVETDSEGRFQAALHPGTWIASARPTGDSSQTRSWFRIEIDPERESIDLRMRNASDTAGRILDPDGAPLAGAEVSAWIAWGDMLLPLSPVITASDGSFRLRIPRRPPSDLGTP